MAIVIDSYTFDIINEDNSLFLICINLLLLLYCEDLFESKKNKQKKF